MTVNSLEAVLSYVGSTGSTSLSFILPGLFYYSISDPNSPHHQRLMKNTDNDAEYPDDEDEEDEEDEIGAEHNPLLANSIASINSLSRGARKAAKKVWPKDMLRKLSLALAIYGILVMVVCLGVNVFKHSQGG